MHTQPDTRHHASTGTTTRTDAGTRTDTGTDCDQARPFRGLSLAHLSDDDLIAALRTEVRLLLLLTARHAELAAELARRRADQGTTS